MNRRSFLRHTGRLALGAGALTALPLWPRRVRAQAGDPAPVNVELVTITPTSAVLTWETGEPTEGCVLFGATAEALGSEVTDPSGRARYHRVELTGLTPGQTVHYAAESDGVRAEPYEFSPGSFTTLQPPPGHRLFTFATITDLHVGLTSAGEVTGSDIYQPVECPLVGTTCWDTANRAVVEAINQTAAELVVVKGDVSHNFTKEQFEAIRGILDELDTPYHVVRGNHDRQGEQPEDYFKKVFEIERTHFALSHKGVRFAILDSSNLESGWPEIDDGQFEFLTGEVASLGDEKLFVVLHHAASEEATYVFSLFQREQEKLFGTLQGVGNLVGVLSGHSHRNIVTHQPELGEVPCIETACTIHYPGGFNLYEVYTGGYLQTYHKVDGEQWRIWEEAGRAMYDARAQVILLGPIADRNFVYCFATPIPYDPPAEPGNSGGCSAGGGKAGLALGAAALGAKVAAGKLGKG